MRWRARAEEIAPSQLGGAVAAGGDHLADRFGAGQIEATVQEGALAELPRTGRSRSGGQHQLKHAPHRDPAAMAVELDYVFPGEAAGGPHQQQQSLIDPLAAGRIDHMAVEHPVALPPLGSGRLKQTAADVLGPRTRDPHDRHTALAGGDGGGDGGDGVGGAHPPRLPSRRSLAVAAAGLGGQARRASDAEPQGLLRPGKTIRSMWPPLG